MIFLIYLGLGAGSGFFAKGGPTDAVVEVDGEKVPLHLFYSRYSRALDQIKPGTVLDQAGRAQKRDETIRDLVQGVVFTKQARKYGIHVPDQQVINSLAQVPAFQEKGAFSPQAYGRALQHQLRATPQEFEEEQRASIAFFKLRYLIQSTVKVTDKELEMAFAQRGAEFAKTNEFETDDKGKKLKRRTPEQMKAVFRDQLLQEKTMWAFNQWFAQIGQKTRVKTHLDLIEGVVK